MFVVTDKFVSFCLLQMLSLRLYTDSDTDMGMDTVFFILSFSVSESEY